MGNEYAGGVHLVLALNGTQTEVWVAATPLSDAISAVQTALEDGWKAHRIMSQQLTTDRVAALKLRPNSVRKLSSGQ